MNTLAPQSSSSRRSGWIESLRQEFVLTLSQCGVVPYLVWATYSAWIFLHSNALAHDEVDFLRIAKSTNWSDFVRIAPPALYGSSFWLGLKLCGSALCARAVVLAMFLATPFLILRTIVRPGLKLAVLLLWLSFPIAWWTGKLIAPEIPDMFLVALALHFLHARQINAVALILGVAVAIKVSILPALGFFVVAYLLQNDERPVASMKTVASVLLVFCVTLFVACPPILKIIHELRQQPGHFLMSRFFEQAKQVSMIERWEWDGVFSGGVLRFSLMPLPLGIVAAATLVQSWRMFVAMAIALCLYLIMNMNSESYYGWYSIGLFPVLLYAASRESEAPSPRVLVVVLCVSAMLNASEQMTLIVGQAAEKIAQIRVLSKRDEIQMCLRKRVGELKPESVLNQAEFGIELEGAAPRIFLMPGPEANNAAVLLLGKRFLVDQSMPNAVWSGPMHIFATCDDILIFTRG